MLGQYLRCILCSGVLQSQGNLGYTLRSTSCAMILGICVVGNTTQGSLGTQPNLLGPQGTFNGKINSRLVVFVKLYILFSFCFT